MENKFHGEFRRYGIRRRKSIIIALSVLSLIILTSSGVYSKIKIWSITMLACNALPRTDIEFTAAEQSLQGDSVMATKTHVEGYDGILDCIRTLKELIYGGRMFTNDDVISACQKFRHSKNLQSEFHDETVIPNIAHFLWFYEDQPLRFDQFISILSAYAVMKADKIMIHTDMEPIGKYWEILKETINTLEIVPLHLPQLCLFNNVHHRTDLARLQILLKYGGVYLDNDVIVVRSLEPLRHYDFVMGREIPLNPDFLNNGIIMASKNSQFLKLFYLGYKIYYGNCWSCDSMQYANALAIQFPDLIHVEERSFHQTDTLLTFEGHFPWWKEHYTVHTFARTYLNRARNKVEALDKVNPDSSVWESALKKLDNSFGEIARYVYEASKATLTINNITTSAKVKERTQNMG
ncbi:uncharacterized protein [Ptychodera flava]|uniref:uncharacterized protein n=1 Tax=Ptychodera flava TaxID=63121 RepID=UPI00396A3B79